MDHSRLLPTRAEIIHTYKARGGRVAAVLPVHYPRALFRAFDFQPIEVWGPPKVDASYGAAHLQPYVCSIVRNALAFQQSGGLDDTDLIVVPHTCDSLQGLGSILIDFIRPKQPVITIYHPRGNSYSVTLVPHAHLHMPQVQVSAGVTSEAEQSPSDIGIASSPKPLLAMTSFLAAEFRAIYARLSEITQRAPTDAELLACVEREERADARLVELHRQRANLPLSQSDFYRLVRAREYLPAETFIEFVAATLAAAPKARPQEPPLPGRVPILLSGIVPEPMSLFDAFDQMSAVVVADDLASCGRRLYPAGADADPFTRMAESILNAPPDSTRGSSIEARLEHLLRLVDTSKAKGVVFYDVKFCEPELFYLPALRKGLQDAGVPSVAVEVDLNEGLSHQILTRLEAFVEMIA